MTEPRSNHLRPRLWEHGFLHLRRLARDISLEAGRLSPGTLVLDAGCGAMPYKRLFAHCRFLGLDLMPFHGMPDLFGVAERLPLRDCSVDAILSTQYLEHAADPKSVIREFRRVLRSDGTLLLSTHGVWAYHPDPVDYWRWTESGLQLILEQCGFRVVRVHRQTESLGAGVILALYPLFAAGGRWKALQPIQHTLFAIGNTLALFGDWVLMRQPRHFASTTYLLVARRAS
jgi:SAM-dependent methyltransferase